MFNLQAVKALRRYICSRVKKNFSHKPDAARKCLLTFAAEATTDRSALPDVLKLLRNLDPGNFGPRIEREHEKILEDKQQEQRGSKVDETVKQLQVNKRGAPGR